MGEQRPKKKKISINDFPQSYLFIIIVGVVFATGVYNHVLTLAHKSNTKHYLHIVTG